MARARIVAALLAAALSGCGGSAAVGSSPTAAATAQTAMSPAPSPLPSVSEESSDEPSPTPLPGFEDWKTINPWAVEMSLGEDGALQMSLLTRVLWFNQERGALLYKELVGDFVATATVRTSRRSEPGTPLAENGITQFGGVMARADEASENYVFIVVGNSVNGPTVETKSTVNSRSAWDGPAWSGSDAELRLCRSGSTFTLLKRPADTDDEWTVAAEIERPDLPDELQVGPNIYSDGEPDLTARWEDLQITTGTTAEDCLAG